MRMRRLARMAAGVSVVAATLVGCGGESGNTNDKIVLGTIGTFTGPSSSSLGPVRAVLEGWVADINDAGGIDGRTVELIVKDDGGNATTALTAARELVERHRVAAIVGQVSVVADTWASVASGAGVPVIGGIPSTAANMTDPNFFPIGTSNVAQTYGKVATAAKVGDSMGDLYCAEAPVCATAASHYSEYGQLVGIDVPVVQKILATAPNYTAPCEAIKNSGVDSYMIDHATEIAVRVADACADQGVTATLIGSAGTVSTEWLDHPSTEGTLSVELAFPFFDDSTPAAKEYQDFLKRHDLGDAGGGNATFAYLGAKLFEAAMENVGDGVTTPDAVKKGLYALKDETLGGLVPQPLTFDEDAATAIRCWFLIAIEDGKFVTPQGLKTECAPQEFVDKAIAELDSGS